MPIGYSKPPKRWKRPKWAGYYRKTNKKTGKTYIIDKRSPEFPKYGRKPWVPYDEPAYCGPQPKSGSKNNNMTTRSKSKKKS